MPRKPTPAGKQRVRTGCLTCRKRRRKCDEQKPRCANCEVKGFTCKYGADLAFVAPQSGKAPPQQYSKITFVDESPVAPASNKKQQQHELITEEKDDSGSTISAQSAFQFLGSNTESLRSGVEHRSLGFSTGHAKLVRRPAAVNASYETDLLRHFRYHVGPWMDLGDSSCAFGGQILLQSRSNRSLQAATLALSAGQRSLLSLNYSQDIDGLLRFRKEAEESLARQSDLVRNAGELLLLIQELLPSGLHRWRDIILPHVNRKDGFVVPTDLTDELGDPLFWLYLRLDMAASIVMNQAPVIPFRSFIQRDGNLLYSSRQISQSNSVKDFYSRVLCLLANCLALLYDDSDEIARNSPAELAGFPSIYQSRLLSEWTFLWTDCQKWYSERPIDAQQIVDIRGSEADQIDPGRDSSFPILIYTTPMALAANAVYHTISFLLLTHKPRLLKSLPGPRCFTSHIWHAQSIAGIATSNDSPDQWDPILVSSLLLIAREMTHEAQQMALLERLRNISTTTGINLEHEIEKLQSAWNVARYEEPDEQDL